MKLKTKKAAAKRLKVTGRGKVKRRKCGQDHFKGRETGNKTRSLRTDETITKTVKSTVKQLLPNQDIS